MLLYSIARYTSLALEPPISCLASPRLATPRRCFTVLCELVLWFGPLERNGDASSIHARIYARRTFALLMLSQSRECNTRALVYTYTGIDTDAVMHREGGGRKRRISTETREKGDCGGREGGVDERIEGGKEGSEGCKGIYRCVYIYRERKREIVRERGRRRWRRKRRREGESERERIEGRWKRGKGDDG